MSLWTQAILDRVHAVRAPRDEQQGHIVAGITACIREHGKSSKAGHTLEASQWRENAEDLLRALERRARS